MNYSDYLSQSAVDAGEWEMYEHREQKLVSISIVIAASAT